MSNEKTSLCVGREPASRSPLPTPWPSSCGATPILSGSTTPCFMPSSSERETCSGASSRQTTATKGLTLAEHVAATDYLDRIGRVAERAAATTSYAELWALLCEGARALGASSAVFMFLEREKLEITACRFMLACDPAWCRHYLEAGLLIHDPWLAYAAHHSEPRLVSSMQITDSDQQRVVDLAERHGFASAALIPVHSGTGHSRMSLLCLGSSEHGYFEAGGFARLKLGARPLAFELHEWWVAHSRRDLIAKARITAGELDLLRRQFRGHSTKRIADEMRVSIASINSRFQRMNAKLGVANRKQAACLAADCGLVDP